VTVYAELGIPVPLRRTFHYRVPDTLTATLEPGMRVLVPFGGRKTVGYVLDASSVLPDGVKTKAILRILDDVQPTFSTPMLAFLRWMADYYGAPVGEVLKSAHPAGTNIRSVSGLNLGPNREAAEFAAALDLDLGALLSLIRESDAAIPLSKLPGAPTKSAVRAWIDGGFVVREAIELKGRVDVRRVLAYRSVAPAVTEPRGRGNAHLRRDEIHQWLTGRGTVSLADIKLEFQNPGPHLRTLLTEGCVVQDAVEVFRDPFLGGSVERDTPLVLTASQENAVGQINAQVGYQGFLLHGITGSGKTEVYLQAIDQRLKDGLGALVLVPEIALTPQLVQRFRARFGDHIAVLHSGLSDGARFDQWRRIASGDLRIVIGARSAVFAPIQGLGIIVVDEEHDPSYKQGEGLRYHARDMALFRGHRENVPVVLGTATPSLETVHNAQVGKLRRLILPARATGGTLPSVELVDLSQESPPKDGDRYLSSSLRLAIAETLSRGEQVIIFLNRRGFSSFVQCTDCGHAMECHRCAISLTWHKSRRLLTCHYCNAARPFPERCPECQSGKLELLGRGTERIEERLNILYPKARIQRLDRDTAGGRGLNTIVSGMQAREIDILIGTQMVTKGHDFPYVTLVCVLDADGGLNFPDFRAAERTSQLLTQVAGRAGRAKRVGKVLVQTWDPEHFCLQALKTHDYAHFCQTELKMRAMLGYPPFRHAVAIRVDARDPNHAAKAIQIFGKELSDGKVEAQGVTVRGPALAALEKIKGRTRWAMLLTASSRAQLKSALSSLSLEDPDRPKDIRVVVDVDPYDLL